MSTSHDTRGYNLTDAHSNGHADMRANGVTAPALTQAVQEFRRAADQLLAAASDDAIGGGELAALVRVLPAIDRANAVSVERTVRVQDGGLAERSAALPLDGVLAFQTRTTYGDRRTLQRTADTLRRLPRVREAFRHGALGWGQVRTIVAETAVLDRDTSRRFDRSFGDLERVGRADPDQLLDEVRHRVEALRPDLENRRALRRIERRFLAVQPQLDGALTLYGEFDPEAATTLLGAIDTAAPPPSAGDRDVTRDAVGSNAAEDDTSGHDPFESSRRRSRARQRADGLLRLAESFLTGEQGDGTHRRARPRIQALCDIRTLTGTGASSDAARALWASIGAPAKLTPAAIRRLASDAHLQLVLTDGTEVLGITRPTSTIPAAVRDAVVARDRQCRFPGCRAPARWADAHHVVPRAEHGPTTVDNLCLLCRRHHTAVTEGAWRLTMTADGTVTVRRGRWVATSDPPGRPALAV